MPLSFPTRPNFLIVMTDQQRADSVSPHSQAKTPHIDAFAKQSAVFENAHCPSPHCCPSRASFFTSLYPSQHGIRNNHLNSQRLSESIREGVRPWSQELSQSGYEMRFTGKWHASKTQDPIDFDWVHRQAIRLGSKDEGRESSWDSYQQNKSTPVTSGEPEGVISRPGYGDWVCYGAREDRDIDDALTATAVETIEELSREESPWCYYVGLIGPHDPYRVPQEYLDQYPKESIELPASFKDSLSDKPNIYRRLREQIWDQLSGDESKECLRHYLAYCTKMDTHFGSILQALEASGQHDNTIVVFMSDHGDYAGDHGLWCKGIAAFDGAYRIPLIVRDPRMAKEPRVENKAFVSICDIGPTLLDYAGVSYSSDSYMGKSLIPFLRGDDAPEDWRRSISYQCDGVELYYTQRSIVTEKYKYVFNGFDFDELYDRQNDPHELINLARKPEYADIIRSLCAELWNFGRQVDDTPISSYITVGLAPDGPGSAF